MTKDWRTDFNMLQQRFPEALAKAKALKLPTTFNAVEQVDLGLSLAIVGYDFAPPTPREVGYLVRLADHLGTWRKTREVRGFMLIEGEGCECFACSCVGYVRGCTDNPSDEDSVIPWLILYVDEHRGELNKLVSSV